MRGGGSPGEAEAMLKSSSIKLFCALPAAVVIAGCIAGNPGDRELNAITISPATASANGSAVQFTATGHWSTSPITVVPQSATWGACTETDPTPTNNVTVSSTGQATCASGASGTYMVYAWDPQFGYTGPVCNAITACGAGCGRISATAELTCP
jgi:hypothetical protein